MSIALMGHPIGEALLPFLLHSFYCNLLGVKFGQE